MFSSINKTFGCRSKILVAATKKLFVVPNFVAVTKQFFFVYAVTELLYSFFTSLMLSPTTRFVWVSV